MCQPLLKSRSSHWAKRTRSDGNRRLLSGLALNCARPGTLRQRVVNLRYPKSAALYHRADGRQSALVGGYELHNPDTSEANSRFAALRKGLTFELFLGLF